MDSTTILTGHGDSDLVAHLRTAIEASSPAAFGIASAFVSIGGIKILSSLLGHRRIRVRLLAGVSMAVTHPQALSIALQQDWELKLGASKHGIFHPKMFIGGSEFKEDGSVESPSISYVGSANLTNLGLKTSTECGTMSTGLIANEASEPFRSLWNRYPLADEAAVDRYAAVFTRRNRTRTAEDLEDLGVGDASDTNGVDSESLLAKPRSKGHAISIANAATVWVGLESHTGGYAFQAEFPKKSANIVSSMLVAKALEVRTIGEKQRQRSEIRMNVSCADGQVREMTFTHYMHNAMSRLNIPFDVPNARWAHENRAGIAVVSKDDSKGIALSLSILRPGPTCDDIARRSFLLGTWDRTSTRCYGWF